MNSILTNPLFRQQPTERNLHGYPSIIEVIDAFLQKEEVENQPRLLYRSPFDSMSRRGKFIACAVDENRKIAALWPANGNGHLFRGENCYHEICLSSIDRLKDNAKERLLARLYTAEFTLLLLFHPVVNELSKYGFYLPCEGLAQHYGIRTSLLDFTSEIWTAAFFATTSYNAKDDSYSPYLGENKYGVLYYSDFSSLGNKMEVIGLNFFNRPGRQSGFAYRMGKNENLNDNSAFHKIFFRHDKKANQCVYDMNAGGLKLFPEDRLFAKVRKMLSESSVSKAAAEYCRKAFYNNLSAEEFDNLCVNTYGLNMTDTPSVKFSQEELESDWKKWCDEGRHRFLESIAIFPVARL